MFEKRLFSDLKWIKIHHFSVENFGNVQSFFLKLKKMRKWAIFDLNIKKIVFYSSFKIMWSRPFLNIRLNTWANIGRHRYYFSSYNRSVYDRLILRINTLTTWFNQYLTSFWIKLYFLPQKICGCLNSKRTIKIQVIPWSILFDIKSFRSFIRFWSKTTRSRSEMIRITHKDTSKRNKKSVLISLDLTYHLGIILFENDLNCINWSRHNWSVIEAP